MKNNITKDFLISFVLSISFCLPITGFIYGFFNCIDCSNSISGFLGRIFIGIIEAFLTTITFGKPWQNEGGSSFIDLRMYVLLCFVILLSLVFFTLRTKLKKN